MALNAADKAKLKHAMRLPTISFVVLLVLLAINVLLGAMTPFVHVWIVELGIMVLMVAVVLLFSMEVIHEPPLVRFFAGIGFFWLAILFAIPLIDYLTR